MPLVVNTNTASINAQNNLTRNTTALNRTLERLSSGLRINRAGDDAAGLQIANTLQSAVRGSQKALDNVQDTIGMLNMMDGAMNTITQNVQRIRELTVQAANDTMATAQRTAIESEVNQLAAEITRVSDQTRYNGKILLNGSVTNFVVQLSSQQNEFLNIATTTTTLPFGDIDATALAINALDYDGAASGSAISTLLSTIDTALTTINARRSAIGALSNRLQSAAENLMYSIEANSAAESRLRDVDVAAESASMIRYQILQQASSTILASANQSPSLALSLLGG